MTPFILRFAQQIPASYPQALRYDAQRQIAQILENGKWVDTPDAREKVRQATRLTKVAAETTDDN